MIASSRDYHAYRSQGHAPGDLIPIANANHFTILDKLRQPNSTLTCAVLCDGSIADPSRDLRHISRSVWTYDRLPRMHRHLPRSRASFYPSAAGAAASMRLTRRARRSCSCLPEGEALGHRRLFMRDGAEGGDVLVPDLAATPAGLDHTDLEAAGGRADTDEHGGTAMHRAQQTVPLCHELGSRALDRSKNAPRCPKNGGVGLGPALKERVG